MVDLEGVSDTDRQPESKLARLWLGEHQLGPFLPALFAPLHPSTSSFAGHDVRLAGGCCFAFLDLESHADGVGSSSTFSSGGDDQKTCSGCTASIQLALVLLTLPVGSDAPPLPAALSLLSLCVIPFFAECDPHCIRPFLLPVRRRLVRRCPKSKPALPFRVISVGVHAIADNRRPSRPGTHVRTPAPKTPSSSPEFCHVWVTLSHSSLTPTRLRSAHRLGFGGNTDRIRLGVFMR